MRPNQNNIIEGITGDVPGEASQIIRVIQQPANNDWYLAEQMMNSRLQKNVTKNIIDKVMASLEENDIVTQTLHNYNRKSVGLFLQIPYTYLQNKLSNLDMILHQLTIALESKYFGCKIFVDNIRPNFANFTITFSINRERNLDDLERIKLFIHKKNAKRQKRRHSII